MKKAPSRNYFFTAVFKKGHGGYTTWIEEIPGVVSEGKTRKEALNNLEDALELMLETNRIMALKDAVGDVERVPISVPYEYA